MMPFLLGVSSVTGHSHSLSPATRLSVHQPQHGIVYTSHKMALYTSHNSPACTPATRWHCVHQSQGGVWCHMSKRWHVATVPLCSIEYPLKTTSVFWNRIPYSNKPSVCAQNSLVIFKMPPTRPPPTPPLARLPPSAIAAATATPIARSADRISGFCFDVNIKGDHGNPST